MRTLSYSLLKRIVYCFALLCIVFIPFPFYVFPFQAKYTAALFGGLISFTAEHLFHVPLFTTIVFSDSASLYILLFLLLIIAFLVAILLSYRKIDFVRVYPVLQWIISYYLSLQLLKYGADKLFKAQFYLPEPNTLFTPFGKLDKDLLFWSTMGVSRPYILFLGGTEILAALLLLFRRTRVAGALIAVAILCNVIAINFSYDVSVKVYSLFLLLLALLLSASFMLRLLRYGILQQPLEIKLVGDNRIDHHKRLFIIRSLVVIVLFFEAFYPYVKRGNYNDDTAVRPFLHGAYEVQPDSAQTDIKRFFVHREGYMIFQDQQDIMTDYRLTIDTIQHQLLLNNYRLGAMHIPYEWNKEDSILTLQYTVNNKPCVLRGKATNWKALPALQYSFHWVSDGTR